MRLLVNTFFSKVVSVDIPAEATVDELKLSIQKESNIPPSLQSLSFNGKLLLDKSLLKEYDLAESSTIYFNIPMGCQAIIRAQNGQETRINLGDRNQIEAISALNKMNTIIINPIQYPDPIIKPLKSSREVAAWEPKDRLNIATVPLRSSERNKVENEKLSPAESYIY